MKPQKGRNLVTYERWNQRVTICDLYQTRVVELYSRPETYEFHHGGWITQSTAKAIRAALESHGLDWHVSIKQGKLYVNNEEVLS